MTGKVTPAIKDVSITIKVGDKEITTIKTDDEGNYKFGPAEVQDYQVFARKEDFIFEKKEGSNDFKSSQLAKLEVSVTDRKTKKVLEGVFLSLSAGKKRITGYTG